MKALIISSALLAAPAYADVCEAYRDQVQNGLELVQEISGAGMSLSAASIISDADPATKQRINEITKRMTVALAAYNEATQVTMDGPGKLCRR